jgi:GrpB protein
VNIDPTLTERIHGSQEERDAAWIYGPPAEGGPVVVVEYDPLWPVLFEREQQRIRQILGDSVLSLAHVGSTSVPGLYAKPILDIDLVVASSADEASYVPPLEAAGYLLILREPNWHEHRMFKGPDTDINLTTGTCTAVPSSNSRPVRGPTRADTQTRRTPSSTASMRARSAHSGLPDGFDPCVVNRGDGRRQLARSHGRDVARPGVRTPAVRR